MSSDRDQLLGMGFSPDRVDWALKATSNRGLQPAMDHILENDGKSVPDLATVSSSSAASGAASAGGARGDDDDDDEELSALRAVYGGKGGSAPASGPAGESSATAGGEAKSIKCSQCGKIFRSVDLANFHAEKSGHDQFEESAEEIKPLTPEETAERLAELRARMSEKRAVKAVEDAKEQKANEALRRKAGKDIVEAKEDLQLKEANKEADQRRRDKIADAKARAAVKAQIEADKKTRAERTAKEKALREGREYQQPEIKGVGGSTATTSSNAGTKSSEYKETRLQIRLAAGGAAPMTVTMGSDSTLHEVALYLEAQTPEMLADSVTFATTFPRKTFTRAEFTKTLKELGLTPSAVLMAS